MEVLFKTRPRKIPKGYRFNADALEKLEWLQALIAKKYRKELSHVTAGDVWEVCLRYVYQAVRDKELDIDDVCRPNTDE